MIYGGLIYIYIYLYFSIYIYIFLSLYIYIYFFFSIVFLCPHTDTDLCDCQVQDWISKTLASAPRLPEPVGCCDFRVAAVQGTTQMDLLTVSATHFHSFNGIYRLLIASLAQGNESMVVSY